MQICTHTRKHTYCVLLCIYSFLYENVWQFANMFVMQKSAKVWTQRHRIVFEGLCKHLATICFRYLANRINSKYKCKYVKFTYNLISFIYLIYSVFIVKYVTKFLSRILMVFFLRLIEVYKILIFSDFKTFTPFRACYNLN